MLEGLNSLREPSLVLIRCLMDEGVSAAVAGLQRSDVHPPT